MRRGDMDVHVVRAASSYLVIVQIVFDAAVQVVNVHLKDAIAMASVADTFGWIVTNMPKELCSVSKHASTPANTQTNERLGKQATPLADCVRHSPPVDLLTCSQRIESCNTTHAARTRRCSVCYCAYLLSPRPLTLFCSVAPFYSDD